MSTILAGATFRTVTIPASIDDADAADFRAMTDTRNRVYRQITGHDDESLTPAELLPHYRANAYEIRHLWVVELDGRVVGRVGVDIPLEAGSQTANWLVELLEEVWGRGIGAAAYAGLVEPTARAHGRTVLQSWAQHPAATGATIAAPTGFGAIPRDHAARFFLRHGYRLEQIDRCSVLDLAHARGRIVRLHDEAVAAATGYRVVQWDVPTPDAYVEDYAWLHSRMSTDAPSAGLVFDEEVWDAERVRANDRKYTDAGRTMLVTAAQHIATGRLCAFNELAIGQDTTRATSQEDTLVLKEHRGHRLGMLVKTAGLLAWQERMPRSPRVITYNAEENRPMLDINEAIGFAPLAYEGAWKKVLSV